MCMQCVAQGTPMIAVGLTVLRRRALMGAVRNVLQRFPARPQRSAEEARWDTGQEYVDEDCVTSGAAGSSGA